MITESQNQSFPNQDGQNLESRTRPDQDLEKYDKKSDRTGPGIDKISILGLVQDWRKFFKPRTGKGPTSF